MDSHSRAVKRPRRKIQAVEEMLPAKQERSRQTADKLLDAAEALLAAGGLDRATVPNIARHAGVSVGVLYRRFPDKPALVRAVYERYFERARAGTTYALDPQWWTDISLVDIVSSLIGSLVAQHRRNRELLRALTVYTQSSADPEFRRRVDALNAETTRGITALLMTRRADIPHPRPEAAIAFGLFMVGATLRSVIQSDDAALRPFHVAEEGLRDELTRMYLGYLRVSGRPASIRLRHR